MFCPCNINVHKLLGPGRELQTTSMQSTYFGFFFSIQINIQRSPAETFNRLYCNKRAQVKKIKQFTPDQVTYKNLELKINYIT